jgi:hypothetical protein
MNRDGMEAHVISTKIVEAIFDDLQGRSGFDAWMAEIDGYVVKEMHDELREVVKDVLAKLSCERDTDNDGDCAKCAVYGGCMAIKYVGD